MMATAESCTGGLISAALTSVPGSSDVFDRGFVTYSYPAKTDMLGVSAALIERFGAVSEEVAEAMAAGARDRSNADVVASVTGVAGPGASEAKPEGMVCFGFVVPGAAHVETALFGPIGRDEVRNATVEHALARTLSLLGNDI